jgi:hypothetical protein
MLNKEDSIKEFLMEYAEILRKGIDLRNFTPEVFPLTTFAKMASGGVQILDGMGHPIAFVSCNEGLGSSMPVGPMTVTLAELFVDLVNAYYEYIMKTE